MTTLLLSCPFMKAGFKCIWESQARLIKVYLGKWIHTVYMSLVFWRAWIINLTEMNAFLPPPLWTSFAILDNFLWITQGYTMRDVDNTQVLIHWMSAFKEYVMVTVLSCVIILGPSTSHQDCWNVWRDTYILSMCGIKPGLVPGLPKNLNTFSQDIYQLAIDSFLRLVFFT